MKAVVLIIFLTSIVLQANAGDFLDKDKFKARFLLAVNATWAPCMDISMSEVMMHNSSTNITVGKCDYGPLSFYMTHNTNPGPLEDYSKMSLHMKFGSHDIEDASPPTCSINWNGTYLAPKKMSWQVMQNFGLTSPLPSCYVEDSREGYHMTYYWFHLLEWWTE